MQTAAIKPNASLVALKGLALAANFLIIWLLGIWGFSEIGMSAINQGAMNVAQTMAVVTVCHIVLSPILYVSLWISFMGFDR
jgi:hypothetical protein